MQIIICSVCYNDGKKIVEAVDTLPSVTLAVSGKMTKPLDLCQLHLDAMGFTFTKNTAKGSGDNVPELTDVTGLISAEQLAKLHGVNDGRQYYYRRQGRLTAVGKYQGKCYYTPAAVESFLHYLGTQAVPVMVEPKAAKTTKAGNKKK